MKIISMHQLGLLGLAILTKGPVAFVLAILTITTLFTQRDWKILLYKINPKKGFLITIFISVLGISWNLLKRESLFGIIFLVITTSRYTSVVTIMQNHSGFFST